MKKKIATIWFIAIMMALSWGLTTIIVLPSPGSWIVAGIGGFLIGVTTVLVPVKIKNNG